MEFVRKTEFIKAQEEIKHLKEEVKNLQQQEWGLMYIINSLQKGQLQILQTLGDDILDEDINRVYKQIDVCKKYVKKYYPKIFEEEAKESDNNNE
ncbi:MAG: hypothetical protein P1Q69_06955 [Candidatus Thorarchaeota archaeon]|nr:hypothetical protein [Candidatus Thorarchaeota archaeon]